MRGFDDVFYVPVSRHTETRAEDLPKDADLEVLAASRPGRPVPGAGRARSRHVFMFNHLEYDTLTLARRVSAATSAGAATWRCPRTTIPTTTPTSAPRNRWRAYAHLLFGNWINEIYQTAPYDLARIGAGP